MKFRTLYDTDVYIRLEYLHVEAFKSLCKSTSSIIATNIPIPLNSFKSQLLHHVSIYNTSLAPTNHSRYGVLLTFMLDHYRSKKQLVSLSDQIAAYYDNLPYFSFRTRKGAAHYLNFYICTRPYFPDGKECFSVAPHDVFYDKTTGRTCRKDNPNAVLRTKKGSVIEKTRSIRQFGDVTKLFEFANAKVFKAIMAKTKEFYVETLKKVCDATISDDLSLPKFSVEQSRRKPDKIIKSIWNRAIRKAEKLLNDTWKAMLQAYAYETEDIEKLENLRTELIDVLKDGHFSVKLYGRHVQTVDIYEPIGNGDRRIERKNYRRVTDDAVFFVNFVEQKVFKLREDLFGNAETDWAY